MPEITIVPEMQPVPERLLVNQGGRVTPEIERLNSTVVKQVEEIVEEAEVEAGSEQEAAPTTDWYYAVPMPGVRYFHY